MRPNGSEGTANSREEEQSIPFLPKLAIPLFVGFFASVASWVAFVFVGRFAILEPSFFGAVVVGSIVSLAFFALEVIAPSRRDVNVPIEYIEHQSLRRWLLYWVIIVVMIFILGAACIVLLLGVNLGGTLVATVGVPITTIYFLILLSRYSTRSFSHDVRRPLRALGEHIARMDEQSVELNRLVNDLVTSTGRLATASEQLLALEKASPVRRKMEAESNIPRLWFRAFSTSETAVSIEVENRGVDGILNSVETRVGRIATKVLAAGTIIPAGRKVDFPAANLSRNVRAIQLSVTAGVRPAAGGVQTTQTASFGCTLQRSGFWGIPQGVEISPAGAVDGLEGRVP